MVREVEDVTLAMAERRQLQHHGREPMVQLAAEAAGAHRGCQVDAGGRDDPHVHWLVASAAKPAYLSRLDRRQQLDLQRVGKLPDLVEEQRAVMGRFDQSLLGGPGVGEGSRARTEELRLQEGVGDRGAVDIDERFRRRVPLRCSSRRRTLSPSPFPRGGGSGGGGDPSRRSAARRRTCPRSASSAALWPMSSASGRRAVISPRPLPHRRGAAQNRRRAARSGGFGRLKASNFARFRESSLAPRMRQSPDDMNGSPHWGEATARDRCVARTQT